MKRITFGFAAALAAIAFASAGIARANQASADVCLSNDDPNSCPKPASAAVPPPISDQFKAQQSEAQRALAVAHGCDTNGLVWDPSSGACVADPVTSGATSATGRAGAVNDVNGAIQSNNKNLPEVVSKSGPIASPPPTPVYAGENNGDGVAAPAAKDPNKPVASRNGMLFAGYFGLLAAFGGVGLLGIVAVGGLSYLAGEKVYNIENPPKGS